MTVASSTNRVSHLGNGSTTVFPFGIAFFAASDLQVYAGGVLQTLGTNYTLSGTAPYLSGSNVTFTVAPGAGVPIVLVRVVPYTQLLDLVQNDSLPPEDLERRLDSNVMMVQQVVEQQGRSFVIPVTDVTGTSVTLPDAAARANQALTFDGSGNVTVGALANAVISSAMQPVASAASVYAARLAMGVANTGGYLNGFRNPFMEVAQRGTTASVTGGTSSYSLDGWIVFPTGANVTWQQSGSITSGTVYAPNTLGLLGASGLTACVVAQSIESTFASQFSGKRVTIQFLIQNQTGAPLTPTITTRFPAVSDDNYGSVTTDLGVTNLQTIASGATATVAYTFDTNFLAARGYSVNINFGNQLNGAGKNVFISAADIRYTPDAPLGLNSAPPRPEYRPRGPETAFCQRYYCVFGPVTAMFPWASGTQIIRVHASFPVVMRSNPSVTMGTKTAGTGTLSANNVTPYGVDFAGSGSIQDVLVYTGNIASSEI